MSLNVRTAHRELIAVRPQGPTESLPAEPRRAGSLARLPVRPPGHPVPVARPCVGTLRASRLQSVPCLARPRRGAGVRGADPKATRRTQMIRRRKTDLVKRSSRRGVQIAGTLLTSGGRTERKVPTVRADGFKRDLLPSGTEPHPG